MLSERVLTSMLNDGKLEINPEEQVLYEVKQSGAADRIYKQFDLGRETYVEAYSNSTRIGDGPVMSRETFDKFSDADPTQGKVFLEWMIFQAGGGADTYSLAVAEWLGETDSEGSSVSHDYHEVYSQWKQSQQERYEEWLVDNEGATFDDWRKVGNPEGGAVEDTDDFTSYIQSMPSEAVMLEEFTRMYYTFLAMEGVNDSGEKVSEPNTYEDAQIMWEAAMPSSRNAHLYGDQDSAVSMKYGFYRNWDDAPKDLYPAIVKTVESFIANKAKLDQILKANVANEKWNASNPDEIQRGIRDTSAYASIDRSIGQFSVKKGIITYSGAYKTLNDLKLTVMSMAKVEFKSKVQSDVQYSNIEGHSTKDSPIYRDDRLTVWVPLTVAASIRRGFEKWCVANQENIEGYIRARDPSSHRSYWEDYTNEKLKGEDVVAFVTFNFKRKASAPIERNVTHDDDQTAPLDKINVEILWKDLSDMGPQFEKVKFWTRHRMRPTPLANIESAMSAHSPETLESFRKGLEAMVKWGKVFDPALIVSDFKTKHMGIG